MPFKKWASFCELLTCSRASLKFKNKSNSGCLFLKHSQASVGLPVCQAEPSGARVSPVSPLCWSCPPGERSCPPGERSDRGGAGEAPPALLLPRSGIPPAPVFSRAWWPPQGNCRREPHQTGLKERRRMLRPSSAPLQNQLDRECFCQSLLLSCFRKFCFPLGSAALPSASVMSSPGQSLHLLPAPLMVLHSACRCPCLWLRKFIAI